MVTTTGIERCFAGRALIGTVQVLLDAHLGPTNTAQHGRLVPFDLRPSLAAVIGQGVMAFFAGIVLAAALHADRDYVQRCVIVRTARLRIESNAKYHRAHVVEFLDSAVSSATDDFTRVSGKQPGTVYLFLRDF